MASSLATARATRHLAGPQSRLHAVFLATSPRLARRHSRSILGPDARAKAALLERPYSSPASAAPPEPVPQPSAKPDGAIVGRSGRKYPRWMVWLIERAAEGMGYSTNTSTAIRVTSSYYDRIARRAEEEASFIYQECGLPESFQTWLQITLLHIYLLSLRLRALPAPLGRLYIQELFNHAFIDFEQRLRGPRYRITKGSLVRKYMDEMLNQQRGIFAAMDAALVADEAAARRADDGEGGTSADAELAAAIWRNVFGAGWGKGMGGVKGVFADDAAAPSSSSGSAPLAEEAAGTAPAQPTQDRGPTIAEATVEAEVEEEADFPARLERLVRYVRSETVRLAAIEDREVRLAEAGDAMRWGPM